jgi:hypothetical protein
MKRITLAALLLAGCASNGVPVSPGDGGGAPDLAGVDCATLDENGCKSDPRCVADYCTKCSCSASFAACRFPSAPQTQCPALPCPFENCNCGGLGQNDCASSPGCAAFTCADCNGDQQFLGCLSSSEGQPACPTGLCPLESCRKDADCSNVGFCLARGQQQCSDGFPPSCQPDGGCPSGTVCSDTSCYGQVCLPPCSAASCEVGQACVNQRCVPQACSGSCPSNFACTGGACQRRTCQADADCDGGACVNGLCWDGLGICTRPAG